MPPAAYASRRSPRYSWSEPSKCPPSRTLRHVTIAGRASSSTSAPGGIRSAAPSRRYSIAAARPGSDATRRLASARSRGATDATCAGRESRVSFKTKTPESFRTGGSLVSLRPARKLFGRAQIALPASLPPAPDRATDHRAAGYQTGAAFFHRVPPGMSSSTIPRAASSSRIRSDSAKSRLFRASFLAAICASISAGRGSARICT